MENIIQYSISPHIRKVAGSLDRRNPVLPGYFCHADPFSSAFRKPDSPAPSFDNAKGKLIPNTYWTEGFVQAILYIEAELDFLHMRHKYREEKHP